MLKLLVVILFVSSVFTDDKVGVIVDNFNKKTWGNIYEQFDDELKHAITQKQFKTSMDSVRNTLGIMQDYVQIADGQLYFICQTRLDTGVAIYKVNGNNQFTQFSLIYSPKSTFTYLHENRNNSKVSLAFSTAKHNYSLNAQSSLAICSVFKIPIVVQYARQVTQNKIDPQECVDLSKLNQYFMPHVDTGHKSWLETITKTCATYQQIVVGMIKYSSNAIAEYLTDLLTPQNIDKLVLELQLNHSRSSYVVSSMFAMNNTYNLPRQQYLNSLRLITIDEIRNMSQIIHQKLKKNEINLSKDEFYLDAEIIDINVQLLARSNTQSYLKFMQLINSNQYFDNKTLDTILTLFDQVDMISDFARQTFQHAGAKGGSASYPGMKNTALAVAGYAQITQQIKVSYSLVLNHMNSDIFTQRLSDMNNFILAIQTSQFYVSQFIKRMNKKFDQQSEIPYNLLKEE